jgi:LacI family transcriptional regulator
MVGIRDVARHAGVSTATVTRVLQGGAPVSDHLRERVSDAIEELRYVPNAAARALTYGRSQLIGLLVPDIANPFFAEVAQGLEDRASESGHHALVASSHLDPDRERQFISAFQDGTLAAVAMTPSGGSTSHISQLVASSMPLVFVDRRPKGVRGVTVRTDSRAATRKAMRHLIELGHRRIAMLTGPTEFQTAQYRLAGFRAAMREAGIPVDEELIRPGHVEVEGGYRAMQEVLQLKERPTAVFSFNNLLTVGALRALQEAEISIPEDMSLLTFDDMSLFPFTNPPITAIAQPTYEMGRTAAELLLAELQNPGSNTRDVVLPTELKLRGSCCAPSVAGESAQAVQESH